jgi:hypothetical protein
MHGLSCLPQENKPASTPLWESFLNNVDHQLFFSADFWQTVLKRWRSRRGAAAVIDPLETFIHIIVPMVTGPNAGFV